MTGTEEQNQQLKQFLAIALDMLNDMQHKMGMFQTQRFVRLKSAVHKAESTAKELEKEGL